MCQNEYLSEKVSLHIWNNHVNQFLDAYNFGYEVAPDGQFHHEVHGPDGVTYGCYGYVNPFGKLTATFYLSDGWGYRIVRPGDDIELFLHKHEHHEHSDDDDNGHDHEHHHDHHGILTAWKNLYFPPICGQFEGTNVRPSVTLPEKPTITDSK